MKTTERSRCRYAWGILAAVMLLVFGLAWNVQAASLGRAEIKSVKTRTADCQRVYWKKVSGAGGYQLAYKMNSGKYKYQTVSGSASVHADVKKRRPEERYTYRVRAYKLVKKDKVYGSWADEVVSYLQKDVAIYGREASYGTYGQFYKSSAAAKKHMKAVTVKTWDFASGKKGRKITKKWTIYVHKNLADTVKRAFNEIYRGSEKFPIHALGGWRQGSGRSEHYDGTAIDINPDENCQKINGKVVVGKYWRPGRDPYSIPKDGEVARILRKYGFTQGVFWGKNNLDYMHFSYFGT